MYNTGRQIKFKTFMLRSNLCDYSDVKMSESLLQYYRDKPAINNNGVIVDLLKYPDSASFKSKQK